MTIKKAIEKLYNKITGKTSAGKGGISGVINEFADNYEKPTPDLSDYYTKEETYNKDETDAAIEAAIPLTDSDFIFSATINYDEDEGGYVTTLDDIDTTDQTAINDFWHSFKSASDAQKKIFAKIKMSNLRESEPCYIGIIHKYDITGQIYRSFTFGGMATMADGNDLLPLTIGFKISFTTNAQGNATNLSLSETAIHQIEMIDY